MDGGNHILASASLSAQRRHPGAALQALSSQKTLSHKGLHRSSCCASHVSTRLHDVLDVIIVMTESYGATSQLTALTSSSIIASSVSISVTSATQTQNKDKERLSARLKSEYLCPSAQQKLCELVLN